jgi:Na+/H+ antiporter NhaA
VRNLQTPLRVFLRTETASAGVLLGGIGAAMVWVNADPASYTHVWQHTQLSIQVGSAEVGHSLRYWLNSGLMAMFFFVVGLEARREFDMGELRERARAALPVVVGTGGMVIPALIYVIFNAGHASLPGWGAAVSTDTAFALGLLALVGRQFPFRLRTFMLTFSVVDDVIALALIATMYTTSLDAAWLAVGLVLFVVAAYCARAHVRGPGRYLLLGTLTWLAVSESGVDPIVVGLGMGLITWAAPAARSDLEVASDLFRRFREQPTPRLARTARSSLATAISPNERLQELWHPWTSFVIVPLFALANSGVQIDSTFLTRAATSRITLGIALGYMVGKPLGVLGATWLVTRLSRGAVPPPIGWGAIVGGGTISGTGFTVSLLISNLAFDGEALDEAKAGVLAAALGAATLTWFVIRGISMLPLSRRLQVMLGSSEPIIDLAVPVETGRDHSRGPESAVITLVEYGDFECPYCGRAEPVVRELLGDFRDLRYVWRHLPLNDVHPHAQDAAEAAEAAANQGAFWAMCELLLTHQSALTRDDLVSYADQLGLDTGLFQRDIDGRQGASRIAEDVDGADRSGVSGTPTFFINGRRHFGAYDVETLSRVINAARARQVAGAGMATTPATT